MYSNLERINLLENVKDDLIKRIEIERYKRNRAANDLWKYKNEQIYIQLDTEHCIDMICKFEAEYNLRRERVARLVSELRSIQLELILLYEEYGESDLIGLKEPKYMFYGDLNCF